MKLSQLLAPWFSNNRSDVDVSGVENDSRQVSKGSLFLAYPGASTDGRNYIEKAIAQGAVAIAYDPKDFTPSARAVPMIPVPHLTQFLGDIGCAFYKNPSRNLDVTGVTGTNGKTTIAYQLAQAHDLLGSASAYIGTIGQGAIHHLKELNNTTPDGLCLQKLLSEYLASQLNVVCMEVSSHALKQHRVNGVEFRQAIFTNLTQDHLDYHHTMEDYAQSKSMLFARPELEHAIINHDDAYQPLMASVLRPNVARLTYGLNEGSDVRATHWKMTMTGTEMDVKSPWGMHHLKIQALGQFNIYNTLAVFTSLAAHGYPIAEIVDAIAELRPAAGRMEIVARSPYVLVDYAHTPDALEKALITLNEVKKQGKLWVVFGCGGDRDRSKRAVMGRVASTIADRIIITSDNPRTEEPEAIIEDICNGLISDTSTKILVNREEAIRFALDEAAADDIVLIAGKGHESYQQIGTIKHHFSDQEVIRCWSEEKQV